MTNSHRHSSRMCAVQMLYGLGMEPAGPAPTTSDVDAKIVAFWTHFHAPEAAREYADRLVRRAVEHLQDIDAALTQASIHWKLTRMAKIDLAILRLATYELLHERDVPPEVVVDEAVELTKTFSTTEAASFVNGVLAPIVDLARAS